MDKDALCVVSGYIADLLFGDPPWFPHPVKGIGWAIGKLENPVRRFFTSERTGGFVLAVVVIGGAFWFTYALVNLSNWIHPRGGFVTSIFFIYTSLAVKDLRMESMRVRRALARRDLAEARAKLAMIVGRDTGNLDEKEIIRATVETIAENIVDGILSPLFYALIGGAPWAIAYKAVNTLDSMVGYKNERYKTFGWASAKIDDAANYIPARLAALLIPIAAWCCGKSGTHALRIAWRDGRKNPSPNSGIPEAAMAGALGVQLGGLNFYSGQPTNKPYIGDDHKPLSLDDVTDSIQITYATSALALLLGVLMKSVR